MYSILLMLHKDSDAACASPRRGLEKLSTIGTSQRPWKALHQKEKNFFSRPLGQISSMCDISSDGFLLPNGSILWSILILWKVVGSWAVNNQPFNVIYIAAA
jgi:hypothetical protein